MKVVILVLNTNTRKFCIQWNLLSTKKGCAMRTAFELIYANILRGKFFKKHTFIHT